MKISNSDIQQLKEKADILQVFGHYGLTAKRAGRHYQCCCPVHDEKTPSCVLDADKNTWHCYGCGKGGDVFDFVKEYRGLAFGDAVREIATIANFELTAPENIDPKEEQRANERRAQIELNKAAMNWFKDQLQANPIAKEYVESRWSQDSIEKFDIGYAPDSWDALWLHLKAQGFNIEKMRTSSLFAISKTEKPYSFFKGRVMMPVLNVTGEPIGFCGRLFPNKPPRDDGKPNPKYINTPEKERGELLYFKSKTFYGINLAVKEIRNSNNVYIVEGNPDVIHMHEIGVTNTIAACGTALTQDHIKILKKLCMKVTLLYDGDRAGQNSIERNGKQLLEAGLSPYAATIPSGPDGEKQDPDTYFQDKEHFDTFVEENRKHWIVWYTEHNKDKYKDPTDIAHFMGEVCQLLLKMGDAEAEGYIDILSKVLPTKKMWKEELKRAKHVANAAVDTKEKFGIDGMQDSSLHRYGFLEEHNRYMVLKGGERFVQVSNFTLKPIFLIASSLNAKRIFRMTNEYGYSVDIEISQKDLGSRAAFRTAVASRGNYLFTGKDEDLDKILAYLYDNTKSCLEVQQMGWQPKGQFWAWSNGITLRNGQFIPTDEQGTVQYDGQWYYIPACSSTTEDDKELYFYERKFIHRGSSADLYTYAQKLINTHGDNAKVALCFVMATFFRDIVIKYFGAFPHLNAFGPKSSGKTVLIAQLMKLQGQSYEAPDGANIQSGTIASLSDHISKMSNGFVLLDEYKNNVTQDKIELMKGAYESRGRMKMDMERDKKRMQTKADCGVVVAGQEMAIADNALFSRMIYMTFTQITEEQKRSGNYEDLKAYLTENSLTPITNLILSQRDMVEEHFYESAKLVREQLEEATSGSAIVSRIIESYTSILAVMHVLITKARMPFPFDYEDLVPLFAKYMTRQNSSVNDTSEVSDFWHGVEFMLTHRSINIGTDLRIRRGVSNLTTEMGERSSKHKREWPGTHDVIYINNTRIYGLYTEYLKKNTKGKNIVDEETMKYYLRTMDAFMGEKVEKFVLPMTPSDSVAHAYITGRSCRAYVFDYAKLTEEFGIELDVETITSETEAQIAQLKQ